MELTELFCVICFTALCTAQTDVTNGLQGVATSATALAMSGITPTVRLEPPAGQIYTTETVHLQCHANGSAPDWTYQWFHDEQSIPQAHGPKYTIDSASLTDTGNYKCQIQQGEAQSMPSITISLSVNELPRPTLKLQTQWQDVFPSERVELSCELPGAADWTFTWYRDKQPVTPTNEGSVLNIVQATPAHKGGYSCQAEHKARTVSTEFSDMTMINVHEVPVPVVALQTPWPAVFPSERVEMNCRMQGSSEPWTFTWYRGQEVVEKGPDVSPMPDGSSLEISSAKLEHGGKYTCTGQLQGRPVKSKASNTLSVEVHEIPVPVVALQTPWPAVFPSERVEMNCSMQGSSEPWTFTWYRGQEVVEKGPDVSPMPDGSSLEISSAKLEHGGKYTCTGQLQGRPVKSKASNTLSVEVHEIPVPVVALQTPWPAVFPSERVEMNCSMQGSSEPWTFTWYRGQEVVEKGPDVSPMPDGSSLEISSAKLEHGGKYTCTGQLQGRPVKSKASNILSVEVHEVPVPVVALQTPWPAVFPSERVEMSCSMQGSSEPWTFTWYRGQEVVEKGPDVSPMPDGSSLEISSAKLEHGGKYTCTGQLQGRPVKSKASNTLSVEVHEVPVPVVALQTPWPAVFPSERVEMSCSMQGSSEPWTFTWYRGQEVVEKGPDVSSLEISSAKLEHGGKYTCTGQLQGRPVKSKASNILSVEVHETPKPTMKLNTLWSEVFPTEHAELNCRVTGSLEWRYTWFRDSKEIQAGLGQGNDGGTLSIQAKAEHAGRYVCRGRHMSRGLSTETSDGLTLKVFDEIPTPELIQAPGHETMYTDESLSFSCKVNTSTGWTYHWFKDLAKLSNQGAIYSISPAAPHHHGVYRCHASRGQKYPLFTHESKTLRVNVEVRPSATITLLTGWSEVFSTDSLILQCKVQGSQDQWNYTWSSGATEITTYDAKLTVMPGKDPDQSEYACKGIRSSRPLRSQKSTAFKTVNLLLKRRVLLSICGCLFFGIIFVFIGCFVMRLTRKPVMVEGKPKEPNLFLTMAELKACDVAPCPLAEYITGDEMVALNKDGEDNDTVCNESTPLPLSSPEGEDEAFESNDTGSNGALKSFKR